MTLQHLRQHPLLRRLPMYAALALAVWVLLREQRERLIEVEVRYHYGRLSQRLVEARMAYASEGATAARVVYSYRARAAGAAQVHRLRLPRGPVAVEAELLLSGPPIRAPSQGGSGHAPSVLRLKRTLTVEQPGIYELDVHRSD